MLKHCRNCGKELVAGSDKICPNCGSNPVKSKSFCRSCGAPTGTDDATCANCAAPLRPISHAEKTLAESRPRLAKAGKIVNLSLVAIVVTAYIIFTLPKSVTKPIQATAADIVETTTGYTSLPLQYIAATPQSIPTPGTIGEVYVPSSFDVNATRQISIYAISKNMGTDNNTKATRQEEVTSNCTFISSNTSVIEVTPDGVVHAVGYGVAYVTAYYTAPPGTSDRSNASTGKIPVTFSVNITVNVGHRGEEITAGTYT